MAVMVIFGSLILAASVAAFFLMAAFATFLPVWLVIALLGFAGLMVLDMALYGGLTGLVYFEIVESDGRSLDRLAAVFVGLPVLLSAGAGAFWDRSRTGRRKKSG